VGRSEQSILCRLFWESLDFFHGYASRAVQNKYLPPDPSLFCLPYRTSRTPPVSPLCWPLAPCTKRGSRISYKVKPLVGLPEEGHPSSFSCSTLQQEFGHKILPGKRRAFTQLSQAHHPSQLASYDQKGQRKCLSKENARSEPRAALTPAGQSSDASSKTLSRKASLRAAPRRLALGTLHVARSESERL
jgi:hypothetical protein